MCDFEQTTAARSWDAPPNNRSSPLMVAEKLTLPIRKATLVFAQKGQATSRNKGQAIEAIPGTVVSPKYSEDFARA